jgi:hypothetical protein
MEQNALLLSRRFNSGKKATCSFKPSNSQKSSFIFCKKLSFYFRLGCSSCWSTGKTIFELAPPSNWGKRKETPFCFQVELM